MVGVDEAGIYNVGYAIAGIIGLMEGTFGYSYTPFLFEQLSKKCSKADNQVVKVSYFFVLALAAAVLLLYLSSGLIFHYFIDERYRGAQIYILWLAIGYFFSGCYKIMVGYIFYASKTIYLTYLSVINIVLNIALNFVLIGRLGAEGASLATMISYFVMFLITFFIANRIHPMPWFRSLKVNKK